MFDVIPGVLEEIGNITDVVMVDTVVHEFDEAHIGFNVAVVINVGDEVMFDVIPSVLEEIGNITDVVMGDAIVHECEEVHKGFNQAIVIKLKCEFHEDFSDFI